jgi:outer membrane protein OmpA-like peptidoglycan-associated protein
MKRAITLLLIILAAFLTVSVITACKTTPPTEETPPEVPPPPPPPPPPPEPEPVPEPEPDTSPPEISVTLSPQPFSPDGDGVDDVLNVKITVESASPVQSWHIEIHEPEPPYLTFSEWSGDGLPPESLTWDGLSNEGELVQSASDYQFVLTVTNEYDTGTYKGPISVDVLVRREEGDVLRVIVPSIVFAPNSAEFINGVTPAQAENNDKILRRIAEILNKYNTYRVKVEGHANPTTAPGTRARANEENGTKNVKGLLPLSEDRAKTVVNYLVNLGIERDRLTPIGVGSARIIVGYFKEDEKGKPTKALNKDNWWKNRRVEFILEK